MHEFLNKIYMYKNRAVAKAKDMKVIILETAEEWMNNKPRELDEIIKKNYRNNYLMRYQIRMTRIEK